MTAPEQQPADTPPGLTASGRSVAAPVSCLVRAPLATHILVAEDDPDHRRWLTLVLERAGAWVTSVDNGFSAVEQATAAWQRGAPFDLIVMDVLMPRLDGLEATRRLRDAGYPHPIVAVTACAMQGDHEACLAAGCDDYAAKPIWHAALVALVARWLPAKSPGGDCPSCSVSKNGTVPFRGKRDSPPGASVPPAAVRP